MKRLALLLCLAFVAPIATATVPPLPPGGVDWEYTMDEEQEIMVLKLKWEPIRYSGDSRLDEYRVYYQINGIQFPPQSVSSELTQFIWGSLDEDSTYVFWITAVNLNGDESLPSTPVIVRGGVDYPYCTAIRIRTNPPDEPDIAPGCVLPPPA